jgi:type IV pilus assembly protein PilO
MKSMTLKNIHEWPLMTRLLLMGLVFAASFYLGYRFVLSGQILSLSKAVQHEIELKQQMELVIRKNKMVVVEISQLPQMQKELALWKEQMVNFDSLPALINSILKLGADNHLFFSLFSPGEVVKIMLPSKSDVATPAEAAPATPPTTPDPAAPVDATKTVSYSKVPIKVVLIGNYHQISDFVSQIANMPVIIAVGNFTISNDGGAQLLGDKLAKQAETQHLLSAELTLDVYLLPELSESK